MKTKIIFLLFVLIASTSNAQVISSFLQADGSYDFTGDANLNLKADSIFIMYKDSFGLGQNDSMHIVSLETDTNADSTVSRMFKYQQYYKGYQVEKAVFNVQALNTRVRTMDGKIIPGFSLDVSSPISEATALTVALAYIGADEYAWENEDYQAALQAATGNEDATYYPTGTLLVGRTGDDPDSTTANYTFAWRFDILVTQPAEKAYRVYVNAATREVTEAPCYSATVTPYLPVIELGRYEQQSSLSDDFNYTSGTYSDLDQNKWRFDNGCGELSLRRTQNITFGHNVPDGSSTGADVMTITAKRELNAIQATCNSQSVNYNYTSAVINSREDFLYGYLEIRCKFPNNQIHRELSQDFWFWDGFCSGQNWVINHSSEIDVFEHFPWTPGQGNDAAKHFPTNFHDGPCGTPCGGDYLCYTNHFDYNTCLDLSQQYHMYGIEWTPNAVTFYLDRRVIPTSAIGLRIVQNMEIQCATSSACPYSTQSVSNLTAMYAIMGQAVRQGSSNPPILSDPNMNFDIDYFHYYKRKPDITGSMTACAGDELTYTASMFGGANTIDTYSWAVTSGNATIVGSSTGASVDLLFGSAGSPVTITVTATEQVTNYYNSNTGGYYTFNTPRVSSRSMSISMSAPGAPYVFIAQIGNICAKQAVVPAGDAECYFSDDGGTTWQLGTLVYATFNGVPAYYWKHGHYTPRSLPYTVKAKQLIDCYGYSPVATRTFSYTSAIPGCFNHRLQTLKASNDLQGMSLFPNPANNELTVSYSLAKDEKAYLEITSVTGSVTCNYDLDAEQSELKISTAAWEGGIYLCRLLKNTGDNETQKLVIIK